MIQNENFPDLRLREIVEEDIEELRLWKNANRASFFVKRKITDREQVAWFEQFKLRDDDFMFVVEQFDLAHWSKIGCMGFRLLSEEGSVDAYNIIRAQRLGNPSFKMGDAFTLLLKAARDKYPTFPIRCKVLTGNPAIAWYQKLGFSIRATEDAYVLMELEQVI